MNVAPDRPVYDVSEADWDRVAELVAKHAEDQITIAGLLYGLNRSYTVREIAQKLKERGVATFSHSWVAKLVKVWGHWVVRNSYLPEHLVRLPITKLYIAAVYDINDLDYVRAHIDIPDSEFQAMLRKERGRPPIGKLVSLPPSVVEAIERTIERLSAHGYHATTIAVLEYAVEVVNMMPDDMLIRYWMLVHGEVPPDHEQEVAGAARALN